MVEVEFCEDERVLLDWIRRHARMDGTYSASDGQIIDELGWREDQLRYFSTKNKLCGAGAIQVFPDAHGYQLFRLTALAAKPSQRYVMMVVPLELWQNFRQQITKHQKPKGTFRPPKPKRETPAMEKRHAQGMQRLGMRPVQHGPIRAPIKQPK
jgi:hypothetical protein